MTTALVSVETVLLVLLIALVAGLLRSHAEILRRLGPPGSDLGAQPAAPAAPVRPPGAPAAALAGPTPTGDAIRLDFTATGRAPMLLAFLTSGCGTCAGFWASLGERRLPAGVSIIVVTHGAERERPARLSALAPAGIPIVMSSQAWRDYSVPGAPYFVLVDGSIRGEGVATSWTALSSLVRDAIEDAEDQSGTARAGHVERVLAAAGIGPEHSSLYPAPAPDPPEA